MQNCAKAVQKGAGNGHAFSSGMAEVGAGYRYLISSSEANVCCRNNIATNTASQVLALCKNPLY